MIIRPAIRSSSLGSLVEGATLFQDNAVLCAMALFRGDELPLILGTCGHSGDTILNCATLCSWQD
jgi:hypothetical protein